MGLPSAKLHTAAVQCGQLCDGRRVNAIGFDLLISIMILLDVSSYRGLSLGKSGTLKVVRSYICTHPDCPQVFAVLLKDMGIQACCAVMPTTQSS